MDCGLGGVEVRDNGCGISPEDLDLLGSNTLRRHARVALSCISRLHCCCSLSQWHCCPCDTVKLLFSGRQ